MQIAVFNGLIHLRLFSSLQDSAIFRNCLPLWDIVDSSWTMIEREPQQDFWFSVAGELYQ